jgi:gas vesicle protein
MEPTIEELKASWNKLMLEPNPPLRPNPREIAPEIKTPLTQSLKDAAAQVIEKRNNAVEWKNSQSNSGGVFDYPTGGVGETINGLEINVFQRADSSLGIDIFDEAYSDKTFVHGSKPIPDSEFEFRLMDTNSRSEVVGFAKDHSIFERMGLDRDEFAQLVIERLEGMANKIDLQSSIQQESTLETSSVRVANERSEADLLPQAPPPITVEKEQIGLVPASSVTWMESLKSQINYVDGTKLEVFAGSNKVYEQTDNVVTRDKLATPLGEKIQQALENPNELKGSVRIMVDGEKVYHAKNGQVLENKHSLTLENSPVTSEKSLNVVPEVAQVSEVQPQSLPVTQSKTPEHTPEVPQVQEQVYQGDRVEIKGAVVLGVSPVVENKTNNNPGLDEFSSSASFDSRSGRQIFSVPLNSSQLKLDERIPKEADTGKVKTKDNSSLNEPQPHRPHKQIFSVPLNPTPVELDAKMPEVVNPGNLTERSSLEQSLASANARIDSLQMQLKDTQKSLADLSKFVRNDNLKSWAEHKVQDVAKTSQSIAEQAKTKVMQWVQAKTAQVKEVVHQKVNEVKSIAQDKVNEVKTAAKDKVNEVKTVAQDKANEVKTVAQNKVSEVKIATQDKVNEVKTAAQLKGIEFKESVREQANKFLAPVNSVEVERAAKHIVREFGDGKSYNKAATHSFQVNDKNELSVARQSDGAVIYQKGALTTAATSHDILKLNALPTVVNQIKVTQNLSHQKQGMEVGGR